MDDHDVDHDGYNDYDEGYYRPAYPRRELFTMCVAALLVVSFVIWGGWKLISLL